jgi:hypothetical protein
MCESKKQLNVCLYASEVAAMIGKNPFKHPVRVLLDVWQRQNHGVSFAKAQARIAAAQGKSVETIGSSQKVIEQAVKKNAPLSAIMQKMSAQVHEKPLPTILAQAESQVKELMTQQKKVCQENLELRDSAMGTLLGVNPQAQVQITEAEVKEYVTSTLSQSYGHAREKQTLKDMPDVKQNNHKFYCKSLDRIENVSFQCRYQLGGKIDGLQNNRLIEIKNRKQRFMQPLPLYDIIQTHCYMWVLDQTECHLIEQLSTGQRKETLIPWNASLWATVVEGVKQFMRVFCLVCTSRKHQDELLSAVCEKTQQKWYGKWLQQVSSE